MQSNYEERDRTSIWVTNILEIYHCSAENVHNVQSDCIFHLQTKTNMSGMYPIL